MDVVLIDYARDPLEKLYGAYRTCYTQLTPREVWEKIAAGETSHEKVKEFVQQRLATGHVSPLEQVVFWFGISGVSRALSHQFVRHRVGISFEQQSQRYVKYKPGKFEFLTPPSVANHKDVRIQSQYNDAMETAANAYQAMIDAGIPAEDARFVFPNAMPTNFQIMVNLAELLHIGDLRLCHRAQWEIRYMVGKMRAEGRRAVPELAAQMQPKCGDKRLGYCDEDYEAYKKCPLAAARPHKNDMIKWVAGRSLNDEDVEVK